MPPTRDSGPGFVLLLNLKLKFLTFSVLKAGPRVVNTLPKNSGGGSDHSGARDDANSYNNSGEDKVIYF